MNRNPVESTILVVDDKPENLDVLINYLDTHGFTILVAQEGEEAYQLAEEFAPDIILLDVMMPGIDGFETCRRLKQHERTREIPVIFMTALSDTAQKVKGFQAGGVDYITKPLQQEEVLARIETHVTLRSLQRNLQQKNVELEQYAGLLERKNDELHELNATKDTFFSIVAHDLRGPLNTLYGLTDVIVESIDAYSKDKLAQMLTNQRDAAKNLCALLENLLTWSRIQRNQIAYRPQQIGLCHIIAKNIALFTLHAQDKQITLRGPEHDDSLFIQADANMVDTIIRNLLSNALKFTEAGGTVEIAVDRREHDIEIAVSDTGIGIDEQGLSRLFRLDAHYRRAGTADEQGTGLGLLLCKEFAEQHGGRIGVESDVGSGTTFWVTLPAQTASR